MISATSAQPSSPTAARRQLGIQLAIDIVVPLLLFYALRRAGRSPLASNVQYVVMLAGLLGWFFPYTARHGLRA